MKLAIVGGRDFNDEFLMAEHIAMFMTAYTNEELKTPEIKVISGGAKGADTLGVRFAKIYQCPVIIFKPDWDKYGKAAGFIRDGKSKGTQDTINKAKKAKKPTFIVYY